MKTRIIFYLFLVALSIKSIKSDFGRFKADYNGLKQNALTYADSQEMVVMAIEADILSYQEALALVDNGEAPLCRHDCIKTNSTMLTAQKIEKRIAYLQSILQVFA